MYLNKFETLNKEQLLDIIKENGYTDIVNILIDKNIDGKKLLDLRQTEMINWGLSPMKIKNLTNLINKIKNDPSIFKRLSTAYSKKVAALPTRPTVPLKKLPESTKYLKKPPELPTTTVPSVTQKEPISIPQIPQNSSSPLELPLRSRISTEAIRESKISQNLLGKSETLNARLPSKIGIPKETKALPNVPQNPPWKNELSTSPLSTRTTQPTATAKSIPKVPQSPYMKNETIPTNRKPLPLPPEKVKTATLPKVNKDLPVVIIATTQHLPSDEVNKKQNKSLNDLHEDVYEDIVERRKHEHPPWGYLNLEVSMNQELNINKRPFISTIDQSYLKTSSDEPLETYENHEIISKSSTGQRPLPKAYINRPLPSVPTVQSNQAINETRTNIIYENLPIRKTESETVTSNIATKQYETTKLITTTPPLISELTSKLTKLRKVKGDEEFEEHEAEISHNNIKHQKESLSINFDNNITYKKVTESSLPIILTPKDNLEINISDVSPNKYNKQPIYENIQTLRNQSRNAENINNQLSDEDQEYTDITLEYRNNPYYTNVGRTKAKELLKDSPDGAFLFRPSKMYFLTLCVIYKGKYYNFGIEKTQNEMISLSSFVDNEYEKFPEFRTLKSFTKYFTKMPIKCREDDETLNIYLNPTKDFKIENHLDDPADTTNTNHYRNSEIFNDNSTSDNNQDETYENTAMTRTYFKEENLRVFKRMPPPIPDVGLISPIYENVGKYFQHNISKSSDISKNLPLPDNNANDDVDNQPIYGNINELNQQEVLTECEIILPSEEENHRSTNDLNLNSEPFFRNTDRKGAKQLLKNLPDGAFLFRPSDRYFLGLTLKFNNRYYNLGIERTANNTFHLESDMNSDVPEFKTLVSFVDYFTKEPVSILDMGVLKEIKLNPVLPADLF